MKCWVRLTPEGEEHLSAYADYRYLFGKEFEVTARCTHIDAGWEFHYRDEYRHLRLYPGEIEILSEEFSDDSEIE